MIEVAHLTKKYGGHLAVDDLSFTVEDGQIYGLLGPNGAGKSTIMNILTGYLSATSGTVTVDGHELPEEAEAAKACIGYLPEQPPLYPEMTVQEYLLFAAELKGVRRAERQKQVLRAARRTGLEEVLPRLIRNLSKGYRQRVGLAQALLGFPDILILDEPTVGLDPKQIIEIRTLIRQLAQKHTIILSSHILSEIQEVCDHLLIIHHGKMMASGTPAELEKELAGPFVLNVTVKGNAQQARQILAGLPGVTRLTEEEPREEGTADVELEYESDVREAVFRACAENELPILEMRRGGLTLEEIFLKLTSDDTVPEPSEPEEEQENGVSEE